MWLVVCCPCDVLATCPGLTPPLAQCQPGLASAPLPWPSKNKWYSWQMSGWWGEGVAFSDKSSENPWMTWLCSSLQLHVVLQLLVLLGNCFTALIYSNRCCACWVKVKVYSFVLLGNRTQVVIAVSVVSLLACCGLCIVLRTIVHLLLWFIITVTQPSHIISRYHKPLTDTHRFLDVCAGLVHMDTLCLPCAECSASLT